jgi:hypothetical protein
MPQLGIGDCFRVGEAHRSIPVGPLLKVESYTGRPGAFEVFLAVARPNHPLEQFLIYSKLASKRFPNVSSLMRFLTATLRRGQGPVFEPLMSPIDHLVSQPVSPQRSSPVVSKYHGASEEEAACRLEALCRRGILQHTRWGLAQLMVNAECRFWQQYLASKRAQYHEVLAHAQEDLQATRQLLQETGERERDSRLREKASGAREVSNFVFEFFSSHERVKKIKDLYMYVEGLQSEGGRVWSGARVDAWAVAAS